MSKIPVKCSNCDATVLRWPSAVRKSKGNFYCSRSCITEHQRTGFDLQDWRMKNRADINAKSRSWVAMNRAKRKEVQRRYREHNKEKIAHSARLRRLATKVNVGPEEYRARLSATKGRCVYCGLEADKIEIDHVEAISRGGGGEIDNVVPACRSCNAAKGASEAADWLASAHGVPGLARALYFLENGYLPEALYGITITEVMRP